MRNQSIILAALLVAALTACKKDCETENTATLRVNNAGDITAYLRYEGEHAIAPGKAIALEIDLDTDFGVSLYQIAVDYHWEGWAGHESVAFTLNQCKATEITLAP